MAPHEHLAVPYFVCERMHNYSYKLYGNRMNGLTIQPNKETLIARDLIRFPRLKTVDILTQDKANSLLYFMNIDSAVAVKTLKVGIL